MRFFRLLALALVGALLGSGPVSAGFLDQSYTPVNNTGLIVELSQTVTQTFTVGASGNLTRVEVEVAKKPTPPAPASDLFLDILGTTGGLPSGPVLASHTFAVGDVPTAFTFLGFDLAGLGIAVTAGDVLAIRLTASVDGFTGIDPYAWRGDAPGVMPRGAGSPAPASRPITRPPPTTSASGRTSRPSPSPARW